MTERRWIMRRYDVAAAERLAAALRIEPIIAALLVLRGVSEPEEAHRALHPRLDQLHDPQRMLGMDRAVARLMSAIARGERILIYGDYDVDGTTGTALLRRTLQMLGAQTDYYIPHRIKEGYGINREALERAWAEGYRLLLSVDCGIRSHEPLEWASAQGMDAIVTDHHLPDPERGTPPAIAVLNPNQPGCPYPDKNLAGVGVAFKLAHALLRAGGRAAEATVHGFLKLVAIGTVADVAPLIGENRTIVALGLRDLPNARNRGLRALMEVAGCGARRNLNAYDIGFLIGPRINAAGRMDAARMVVQLLEAEDDAQARELAGKLDEYNRERQRLQGELFKEALVEVAETLDGSHVVVVAREGWHRGVIGLVASKLVERTGRPAVVISLEGDNGHGSARSIEEYHLLDGLSSCAELFEDFGGHKYAAGLRIKRERIEELRQRLNEHAAGVLRPEDLTPALRIDMELPPHALTLDLAREIEKLEPFGTGWRRPIFLTRRLEVDGEPRVFKERHLKFCVRGADNTRYDSIWWRALESGRRTPRAGEIIELVYSVELDRWRRNEGLVLVVEDCRVMSD